MNRKIVFRGKCAPDTKYAGEWVTGGYVPLSEGITPNDEGLIMRFLGGDITITYHVVPNTVGQFTGLQDSNGNDIYEGDILKVYYHGKSKLFGVVKFGESRFYIDDDFRRDSLKSKAPMAEMFSRYDFEVIGNVVDNPELLKGGEK